MIFHRSLLTILMLVVALAASSVRAEIVVHVSPAGEDQWSGGLATPNANLSDGPVASLGRARDRVRELRARAGDRSGWNLHHS
jgi:hypothetical protein